MKKLIDNVKTFVAATAVTVATVLSKKKQEADIKKPDILLIEQKKTTLRPKISRFTLVEAIQITDYIVNIPAVKPKIHWDNLNHTVLSRRSPVPVKLLDYNEDNSKTTALLLMNPVQHAEDKKENEDNCCKISASVSAPISFIRSVYSFFNQKPNVNTAILTQKALENFTFLAKHMSEELEDWLVEIMKKMHEAYDPNDQNFIHDLVQEISNYPELPEDITLLAEIEQITEARIAHHAKIKLTITDYLASSRFHAYPAQAHNATMEL